MTIVDQNPTSQRAPWAKQRILETATVLFYDEGIRVVGVDRLISASEVTKATFYKHYGSKDNLVAAYVAARHRRDLDYVDEMIRLSAGPAEAITALTGLIVSELQRPGFRGCLFLNAAAEYPDATHPVRVHVTAHRDWYSDMIAGLLARIGHPLPGEGADEFVVARDGAMVGSSTGDSIAASGALQRIVARVLADANN